MIYNLDHEIHKIHLKERANYENRKVKKLTKNVSKIPKKGLSQTSKHLVSTQLIQKTSIMVYNETPKYISTLKEQTLVLLNIVYSLLQY